MTPLPGHTRTRVALRHALISPDGHVPGTYPGWDGASAYVLISPAMGSDLSQILVVYESGGGTAWFPADESEHAVYVESGDCRAVWDDGDVTLTPGGFLYVPSENVLALHGSEGTRIVIFRKLFEPVENLEAPPAAHGNAEDFPGEPHPGNESILVKSLLPLDARYDLALNIVTCPPGSALPAVETQVMEHCVQILTGQGLYRLDESHYPVAAGDAVWVAPYCPQWFVATGDEPASYLYCKDVHRLP